MAEKSKKKIDVAVVMIVGAFVGLIIMWTFLIMTAVKNKPDTIDIGVPPEAPADSVQTEETRP